MVGYGVAQILLAALASGLDVPARLLVLDTMLPGQRLRVDDAPTSFASLVADNAAPLVVVGRSGLSLHARGVAKSTLETLVLRDCTGLLTLPDTLGNNLVNLHTLNMRGCANLQSVPSWVAEMERAGVAVQRPHHLE